MVCMYTRISGGWFKHLDFIILDVLCLQISFIAAYMIRHGFTMPYGNILYRSMAAFLVFADLAALLFLETMKDVLKRGYYREVQASAKHVCIVTLLEISYLFSIQAGEEYSRSVLFLSALIYLLLTYFIRIVWKTVIRRKRPNRDRASLLLLTVSDKAELAIRKLKDQNYRNVEITGIVTADRDMTGETVGGIPVVASREKVLDYVCREWVDEVIFVYAEEYEHVKALTEQLLNMGITVHVALEDLLEMSERMKLVETMGRYTVLTGCIGCMTDRAAFVKRAADIIGGIIGCVLTAILFLFLAPVIYIQSPGSVFFSQTRVGRNGRRFKMYKFRSMYPDAEDKKSDLMSENQFRDGKMFLVEWDPRIIGSKEMPGGVKKKGIGNIMRDFCLDEFPQFYNVLKGDMSLVGTRPPTEDEYEKYEYMHRARLSVKPGMTGLWQIKGRRKTNDFDEVVKMDMEYINTWSFGLDIKILLQTIFTVAKHEERIQ